MKNYMSHVILSAAKDLMPPSLREVARLAATEGVIRTAEALFQKITPSVGLRRQLPRRRSLE